MDKTLINENTNENINLVNENINYYVSYYFYFLDTSMKNNLINYLENYLENKSNFNNEYYKNKYNGLDHVDDYYHHYLHYGLKEGRICSPEHEKMCKKFNDIALNRLITYYKNIKPNDKKTHFNILIRTSNRPNEFKKCLKSIYDQNYLNVFLIISYDNNDTLTYIQEEKIKLNHTLIDLTNNSIYKHKCYYNLYCNELLKYVTDGWCFFLDDDDEIICPNVLHQINNEIEKNQIQSGHLLIFHNLRYDKILKIKDPKNPKAGEVAISSFLFHSKYNNISLFTRSQTGDYDFFINMFNHLKPYFFNYPIIKINHYM